MRLNQNQSRRLALSVFLASAGTLITSPEVGFAGGHGPIYRTLDALAGGIEKVIDVATSHGKHSMGCDDALCDDGCDPMMLSEFESNMGTPVVSAPYHAPSPPAMPLRPAPLNDSMPMQSTPMESLPVESMQMTPVPQINSPTPASPSGKATRPSQPAPVQPLKPAEDDWLDSFSPEPPSTDSPQPRRGLPTPPPAASSDKQPIAVPKRTQLRNPAETFDSLPDPFEDDQSSAPKRSPNRQVSYWEPW